MNVDSVTAEIRPREPWEAVDLGIALARRDYGKILRAKMLVVWPVWAILIVLLHNHSFWLVFGIWWINAAWEKIPLYFISRSLFGSRESMKTFLKDWPGFFFRKLSHSLFTWRLSANRSLLVPAVMLEGVEGLAQAQRNAGLKRFSGLIGSRMGPLFFLILHACWIQLAMLAYWLVPFLDWREVSLMFEIGDTLPPSFFWVCLSCYLIVSTLLAPFYAGAGFGMYINARTRMEGWDVELSFRRMAQRIRSMSLVLIFFGLLCGVARGQDEAGDPQQVMREVLSDDAFHIHTRTEKKYKRKVRDRTESESGTGREPEYRPRSSGSRGSRSGGGAFGGGGGFDASLIGWIALGAVGVYLLFLIVRMLMDRFQPDKAPQDKAKVEKVLGLNVSQQSLPKDLVTRARELYEAGETRESMVLLYRGALSWMIYQGGVSIQESDTEIDCLVRSSRSESAQSRIAYFQDLTFAWIRVAYGKEEIPQNEMHRLLEDWCFAKQAKAGPGMVKTVTSAMTLLLMTFLAGCGDMEVEEEIVDIGYKGPAKIYPFLAVERFLNQMSVKFERVYTFTEMPETSAVILYPSEVDQNPRRAVALMDWVNSGGRMVYLLSGTDPNTRWVIGEAEVSGERRLRKGKQEKDTHYFLDELGVSITDSVENVDTVRWGGRTYDWGLTDSPGFVLPKEIWEKADGYRVGEGRESVAAIQIPYGEGMLTLVGQAQPWRNRYVGKGDHASIFWDIISRGKERISSVWLVRGSRASFRELLMKYAWMPLLSAIIYLLIWLWKSVPRFGPMIPDPAEGNRDFLEHLLMTGRFFARQHLTSALVDSAKQRLQPKLRRFNLSADPESDPEWQRLSAATEVGVKRLRWALGPSREYSQKDFCRLIQVLQKIDQKL